MNPFMEIEWNAKWDWENLPLFGSKAIESPKNLQLADWTIVDDGEIHAGSSNLSAAAGGGGGNSGASGSDGRQGSSAKSSISASTDSCCKDGMQTSIFKLSTSDSSCQKLEMNRVELSGGETSVASAETLLGLKLGKRTYLENSGGGGGAVKSTSSSGVPTPSIITALKKTRSSGQNAPLCCQVEGCSVDLSLAKEYHRKHRVCDCHSKCPKVIVGGRERRFCQQCSRFHSLFEFDEKKRSCRRRLSDHNARRRKPQQETIQFNPPRLSTPFYGGGQQMNFMLNNVTKGCWLKSDGGSDEELHMAGMDACNGLLVASKNAGVLHPGVQQGSGWKGGLMWAAPEYGRALSLLSTHSCSASVQLQHQHEHQPQENGSSFIHHPMVKGIPEGVPFSSSSSSSAASSELWPSGTYHHHHRGLSSKTHTPYDTADCYSNVLN